MKKTFLYFSVIYILSTFYGNMHLCFAQSESNNCLLETVWGGTKLTNKFNPDNYSPGCHSTALAQILFYHKLQPKGVKEYQTIKGHSIKEDYSTHQFNWELFPTKVDSNTNQQSIDELALFTYYVATIVEKNFGNGSYQKKFHKRQLKKHFDCKVKERFGYKSFPLGRKRMKKIIMKELNHKRPVYFHYTDFDGGGHSIVIDSYKLKDNQLWIHANFGWGGKNNGWYEFKKNAFLKNTKLELLITIIPRNEKV